MINKDFLLGYGAGKAAGGGGGGGGGGSTPIEDCDVIFVDYDGTELYGYSKEEFAALTEMPANPSHTGLVAQGWNWALADAKTYVAETGLLIIGQNYITASGATEIDIELPVGHLSPSLGFLINGEASVDWGDSSVQTVTGTSMSTLLNTQHVYSDPGKYTIKISSEVNYGIGGNSTPGQRILWNQDNVSYADGTENAIYGDAVRAIRCGRRFTNIDSYGLNNLHNLETIAVSNNLVGIGSKQIFQSATRLKCFVFPTLSSNTSRMYQSKNFQNCYSMKYVSFPKADAASVGSSLFSGCFDLKNVSLGMKPSSFGNDAFSSCMALKRQPYTNNLLSQYIFSYCASLKEIVVPSVTTIPANAFANCQGVKKMTIPESVTTINGASLSALSTLEELHMQRTSPPALANQGLPTTSITKYYTKIFVPYSEDHSVLEAYKTASQWSTYASYPDCFVEEVI